MARLDRAIALFIVLTLARPGWAMTAKRGTSILRRTGIRAGLVLARGNPSAHRRTGISSPAHPSHHEPQSCESHCDPRQRSRVATRVNQANEEETMHAVRTLALLGFAVAAPAQAQLITHRDLSA